MYQEHVVDGVQDDQDDLGVLGGQQVDNGLQGSALHQGDHLLHGAPAGEVVHHPHSFPLCLEVSLLTSGKEKLSHFTWKLVHVEHCVFESGGEEYSRTSMSQVTPQHAWLHAAELVLKPLCDIVL